MCKIFSSSKISLLINVFIISMLKDYFSLILFWVIRLNYPGYFNVQQFYEAIIDEASAFGNKSIVCYNQVQKCYMFR